MILQAKFLFKYLVQLNGSQRNLSEAGSGNVQNTGAEQEYFQEI